MFLDPWEDEIFGQVYTWYLLVWCGVGLSYHSMTLG